MDPITTALVAGFERDLKRLRKTRDRYARLGMRALERLDFDKAVGYGAKAAALKVTEDLVEGQLRRLACLFAPL
jgi:hypothetical protein